jgi:hypothetical protein
MPDYVHKRNLVSLLRPVQLRFPTGHLFYAAIPTVAVICTGDAFCPSVQEALSGRCTKEKPPVLDAPWIERSLED